MLKFEDIQCYRQLKTNSNFRTGHTGIIVKPTWLGCPLFPPRLMLPPPPLLMFPRFIGPPLFMCPPLGPMLPLIGPPLGDPPRLGMGPPPRLKLPRLGKPPLNAGGGRKPRGGRLKPPRGPGAADTPDIVQVRMNCPLPQASWSTLHHQCCSVSNPTSSEVASILEATTAATSLSKSTAAAKLVLASPAATTQSAASFWRCASLVGLLLSRQSCLAFLFVLFQQLGSVLLLILSKDDLVEALSLLRQREEACKRRNTNQNMFSDESTQTTINLFTYYFFFFLQEASSKGFTTLRHTQKSVMFD